MAQYGKEQNYRKCKILLWFLCLSRNTIVVLVASVISYVCSDGDQHIFHVSRQMEPGLPPISLPQFEVTANNRTYSFIDMGKELGAGILVVPFLAILSNVAIAKNFCKGKSLDASQEMLALGLCNVAGSFISSMPVNASFSRAAVSTASGVRTPFSGIYTSLLIILSLTFLTPFFGYIPKACLASVIICAVVYMVEITTSKEIWELNKIDILPLLITFFACLLLGLEVGILIGLAIDIILLLFYISRPHIDVQKVIIHGKQYTKIIPSGSIYYPSAEFLKKRIMMNQIESITSNEEGTVIIDCSKITKTDFTTARCMGTLVDDLQKSNKRLAFLKLEPHLSNILKKTCRNGIFASTDDILTEILKEKPTLCALTDCMTIKTQEDDLHNDLSIA